MRKQLTTALAAVIAGFGMNAAAQTVCIPDGVIAANTVWGDNETEVVLQGALFVTNGATLTILPGVTVRGWPQVGS